MIVALLVSSDLLAVVASFFLSYFLRLHAPLLDPLAHGLDLYLSVWPVLLVWPFVLWREKLYPGFWLTAREELRRTVIGTTLASLIAVALTFLTKTGPDFSRPIVVGGWAISLFLLPAARYLVRLLMIRLGLWGPPAVILGAAKTARLAVGGLLEQRPPALRPVAVFDDDPSKRGELIDQIPVVGPLAAASAWAKTRGIRTAIVAMPGVPGERLIPMIERYADSFQRILVIPDLFGLSAAEADVRDLQGSLALEIRKNLLYRRNRIAKRIIDLCLLLAAAVLVLPVVALVGLAILAESGRPIFFGHQRVGRHGRPFTAWKFRTMVQEADRVLRVALAGDPALDREWESAQKLKRDPRLTRVGGILRRLSLDELPQLWNVLRGEMSLVGPRPIVAEEVPRYGERISQYYQVLPGLTGLWQVSGRSDLRYEDRVWLDMHYVRNWSVWLDLVILVRTVWVVIAGVGAY